MAKLKMCRICLVENVRMHEVGNRNLQEVYEKLTDIPFVTEDPRPMLVCFFCYTKLKQCWQLQRKCLKAEELFANMLNEGHKYNLKNQNQLEFLGGFTETKLENISIGIGDGCEQSAAIKEELPDVCETQDDIELKVECLSDASEPENREHDYPEPEKIYIEQHQTIKSESEDDMPLMKIKIKEEKVQETPKKNQRANEISSASATRKPELELNANTEKTLSSNPKKNRQGHSKVTKKRITTIQSKVRNFTNIDKKNNDKPKSEENSMTFQCSGHKKESSNNINETKSISSHLKMHISRQAGIKPHKCNICQKRFSVPCYLKRHYRIHTGEKPYKCNICQKSFNVSSNMKNHIRMHTNDKPLKCNICQKSFNAPSHLKRHVRIHTGEKPYKCNLCQKSFSQTGDLGRHIRSHSNERTYKCGICQKSFKVSSNLKNHMLTHTHEKSYKCDACRKSFSLPGTLKRHMRTHTNEKPYKCDICQKSFSDSSSLQKHIRVHTGEKPFKCDKCEKSFNQMGELTRHIRTRHTTL